MKKNTLKSRFDVNFVQGFILIFVFGFFSDVNAQVQNNGIVYISDNASLYVADGSYIFGANPAQTKTTRTFSDHGEIIFATSASYASVSDSHYVDGYATTLGGVNFVFPIGDNGKHAPLKVISPLTTELSGAYFNQNPLIAFGNVLNTSVDQVSPVEYWDLDGFGSSVISLSWRATSNIAALTNNDLSKLIIVGYNGTEWVEIGSQVDVLAFTTGVASTLNAGTITSLSSVNFNNYSAYSLGAKVNLGNEDFEISSVVTILNDEVFFVNAKENIKDVQIFDVSGRLITAFNRVFSTTLTEPFKYSDGIYVVKVTLESGITITKKLINNNN